IVGGDAQAPIADGDDGAVAFAFQADIDRLAVAVLDGVRDEVRYDLVEPTLVPATDDGVRRVDVQRRTNARGLVGEARADLVDDLREVDQLYVQLEPSGGDARHVEQFVDQTVKAGRLRIDLLDLRNQARRAVGAVPA